jgi:hypothetical protein
LAAIFGVTSQRVGQILDEYVPMWGKIGLLLSILTITPEFIKKSITFAYISGFSDVSFGFDGKDIMTGSFPSKSLVMRNIWSYKLETEGRGLAFNMQTGLTTEHTPMCGARPAETNHCQVWGSCMKQVPLIREVEPPRNGVGIFGNSASLKKEKTKESKKRKKAQKGTKVYDSDNEVEKTPLPTGMFDTFVKNILSGANKNADRKIKDQEEALSDDEFITRSAD